jgi:putative membrane-bound dehydrogenase-like protein
VEFILRRAILVFILILCQPQPGVGQRTERVPAPLDVLQDLQAANGFDVQLVASEPMVRQPVAIEFDDRGRLWCIQYLQYPNPAELQRVNVDRYSRTQYDRVPPPPPKGPRGADRITILEDANGDGRIDSAKDFINGLNLATGFAFGNGGVFVLNVPYLLFYPDRDRDDVPDSEPEVLLSGFGMEDAHSVANSLTFGPDGWLYGCQGSTVTANINGIEFQQGVWRYHPVLRKFELFCEGGGNSWGLDFDRVGNLLYSTNYGGFVCLHAVQGGYFVKSFAKHGPLHNPHSYGYFDHTPHTNFQGGHVTVGGMVYQGDSFPDKFRDTYIAGDLLGHGVRFHTIEPWGSTCKTIHGGDLLQSSDRSFAPTDLTTGPDGAVYVSDWSDLRTAHPDPDADWDRSNGRIYRIACSSPSPSKSPRLDYAKLSDEQIFDMHSHSNQWFVRHARQEWVRRKLVHGVLPDNKWVEKLNETALHSDYEINALESFWTYYQLLGIDEGLAMQLLNSPHPSVRLWTIRLLGDEGHISDQLAHRLDEIAETEPSVAVRAQIACTAARLPAAQAVPMINANINRDLDNDDPRMPLLWWWAVERHSCRDREEVLNRFRRPTFWKSRLGRETLMPRLARRYAAEGTEEGLQSLLNLIQSAPDEKARAIFWPAINLGLNERSAELVNATYLSSSAWRELANLVLEGWQTNQRDKTLLKLSLQMGLAEPLQFAKRTALDESSSMNDRAAMMEIVASAKDLELLQQASQLIRAGHPTVIRKAALSILSHFDSSKVAETLVGQLRAVETDELCGPMLDLLVAREPFAKVLVEAVQRGEINASMIPIEKVRHIARYQNQELNALVTRHWGRLESATREELLAEVRRLNNDLRAAPGNPESGQGLFEKHCASCHTLFGAGRKVGPDLTSANRQDRDFLLVSLVDPNSLIRKEYVSVLIRTEDGRVLTGLPAGRDDATTTLINSKGEAITVDNSEIAAITDSPVSIMPADLYRSLTPGQLRDLFAYLQRKN